jgi:hypothetical protein
MKAMEEPIEQTQAQMETQMHAQRRAFQVEEARHKAVMLASFYSALVEGGYPEEEAASLTQVWLENGMSW